MITMEKFIKSLEKIKVEGRWSLGLVIGDLKDVENGVFPSSEKILADGALTPADVIRKIAKIFTLGRWVILEIKKNLPAEICNQLKSLSARNCLVLPDGAERLMPDTVRVVVVAKNETVKAVEKFYPDFKFLFGPIINAAGE